MLFFIIHTNISLNIFISNILAIYLRTLSPHQICKDSDIYTNLRSWTDACSFSFRNSMSATMSSSSNFLCSKMLSCLSTLHCTIAIQCSFDTAASSGFSIKFWQQINYIINAYHSQLNILNLL